MLNPSHNARGFTLVELIITVLVAAVMLALGVPAMSTFISNASIRTNAEALSNGIQLARAEAIRRNASVRIVLNATGTAWTINQVSDNSLIQQRDAEGRSEKVAVTPTASDGSAATTLTFTALGGVTANADASLPIVAIKITPSTGSTPSLRDMCVMVSVSGIARLCDPLRSTANLEPGGSGKVTTDPMSCQPLVPVGCQ